MKDSIRFLVLWVGTKCTLKCENCCNLIPHAEQVSYDFNCVLDNLEYITKNICIKTIQIQGGEPFTHPQLYEIIQACAINKNIESIEIASNGTVMPSSEVLQIIKQYKKKIVLRFSKYKCVENRQKEVTKMIEKNGVTVQSYDFIFGSGLWFDSGKIDQPFNNNYLEVEQIYKECTTKECWVLANNYMAQCGKIINLLEIKGGELSENNVIDVTNSRIREIDFRIVLDKFDHNYKTCIPSLCGYCKKREGYIEPAIQIRD